MVEIKRPKLWVMLILDQGQEWNYQSNEGQCQYWSSVNILIEMMVKSEPGQVLVPSKGKDQSQGQV